MELFKDRIFALHFSYYEIDEVNELVITTCIKMIERELKKTLLRKAKKWREVTGLLSDKCGNILNTYIPNYVVFDLETTGIIWYSDRVVEISAVKVRDGRIVDEYSTLVNPGMHIPSAASYVNGITDEMVKDSPSFSKVLPEFLDFAGDEVLVGHNIQSFDLKFIYRDAEAFLGKTVGNDYIDTLKFAKKIMKCPEGYSLSCLAEHYGICSDGAHRALNDCRMNQKVFECLGKEMGALPQFCGANVSGVNPGIIPGTLRCPKCGSSLMKRSGRFGEFWGCLNYPNCTFTRDAK